jgi:hypothetical protein
MYTEFWRGNVLENVHLEVKFRERGIENLRGMELTHDGVQLWVSVLAVL